MTKILKIALPLPLRRLFDYLPPQAIDIKALIPGIRVLVPFQSRSLVGILIEVVNESSISQDKLKPAIELLDESPLFSPDIYRLCEWAAQYYHYALGEVLASALPGLIRKGEIIRYKPISADITCKKDEPLQLSGDQAKAVSAVCEKLESFQTFLLDGVTGSGKTEVYLQIIAKVLSQNKQVLVLLPEISLTPQTIARFRARFSVAIVTFHSGLSEQERLQTWLAARRGDAKIVIGTRSAVFMPFEKLGVIIVDEEHDTSFKQQDRFRYQARDLAVMRASMNNIPIVLGSATPSLESLLNVRKERYEYLSLPERAANASLPQCHIIDLKKFPVTEGLSLPLSQVMHEHLLQNNQVMLFLNRRGFAPVLFCTQCAWSAVCKRCDARMVYHQNPPHLQCHHCASQNKIPSHCPSCHEKSLQPIGLGTQRLEKTLAQQFPDIPIIRVDRDNTRRKNSLQNILEQIHAKEKAILLGTQMLAKGHHFPHVTLVGVIDVDGGLFSVDFRAAEQMGQLLLQIAGRAGRAEKLGTVLIQTRYPEHPLLKILLNEGYQSFANSLLAEREQAVLPPFSHFALFKAEAYAEETANQFLEIIKQLSVSFTHTITLLGPVSALIARRKGLYCQHLLVKAATRTYLQSFLREILIKIEQLPSSKAVKWIVDVDPVEVF